MKKLITFLLFIVLLISSLSLAIFSSRDDSLIVDEIPHIGAGYSYLKTGEFRLNPEHPPLAKDLAAIPLLFMKLNDKKVFSSDHWTADINGQWDFGRVLIYQSGNDADAITQYARMPVLIFFVLTLILIFIWSRKLFGNGTALLASFLFAFSPTMLAHGRFVTTDMAAAFGTILATYFFINYLKKRSRKALLVAGLMFGVAQLTKFSLMLLVPFFVVLLFAWLLTKYGFGWKRFVRHYFLLLLLFFIAYIGVVYPFYAIHTRNYSAQKQHADTEKLIPQEYTVNRIITWASDKPVLRPFAQYVLGLSMVTQRTAGGNTAYFLGDVNNKAWKHYFPIVYLIKEPLAWWILVIIALLLLPFQIKRVFPKGRFTISQEVKNIYNAKINFVKNHLDEFAMVLWLAIYWAASILGNLNIGVRHLLPIYPFTIILIAGQIHRFWLKLKARNKKQNITVRNTKKKKAYLSLFAYTLGLTAILSWYLYANLSVFPFYLTYFNELAGGPSGGYRYVVDSNLDWGQDIKRLAQWVDERGIEKIQLDYFGWADPRYYLGNKLIYTTNGTYKDVVDFRQKNPPRRRWIAISAGFYMTSRENKEINYSWLDSIKPVARIGNSIFVWKL